MRHASQLQRNGRSSLFGCSIQRLFLGVLVVFYLGFSWWTSRLVLPEQPQELSSLTAGYGDKNLVPAQPNYNATLENLSSVDFYACCGLGHRFVRQSLAAYVAKQHNFALRAFWGWYG